MTQMQIVSDHTLRNVGQESLFWQILKGQPSSPPSPNSSLRELDVYRDLGRDSDPGRLTHTRIPMGRGVRPAKRGPREQNKAPGELSQGSRCRL